VSDDLEDVSVVETTVEPVAGSTEPVATPADTPTEGTPSDISSDERVLQDTSGNDKTYEDYAKRQAAQEQGHTIDAPDNGRAPITEAGRQKKTDAEEEKKSQFFEAQQQAEARRKDFLEKDHDFGGIKMSGHDLAKIIDFISDPEKQKVLRERLGKSGMPKEKIDKGMKELNEYIELKKKEQEGQKLTEEQQRRLKELEKSEEFKAVAAAAAQQVRENGIELSGNKTKEGITALVTDNQVTSTVSDNQLVSKDNNLASDAANEKKVYDSLSSLETARSLFSSAPHLSDEFTAKVAVAKPAPVANDVNNGFDTTTPAAVVAQAQVKPKAIDVSFG
jgi:hypothetical protein